MKNLSFFIILGVCASIANNGIMWLSSSFSLGIYMDTIFTVAVVFLAGILPGFICAILTTAVYSAIYYFVWGTPYYWAWYLYILCSIAAVLLVKFFERFFPDEFKIVKINADVSQSDLPSPYSDGSRRKQQFFCVFIMLTILSLVMCILMSIAGGLISAAINLIGSQNSVDIPPESYLRLGFIKQGFSLTVSEILSRIPVNMADRPIAVFCGYGIALLIKRYCKPHRKSFARAGNE